MMLFVKTVVFFLSLVASLSSATEVNLRSNVQAHQDRELTFWWKFCWWPYVWDNYQCKYCYNNYVCPANSCRKGGLQCYDGFDDCECNYGFVRNDHEKICNPICKNDYICPANSYRIANRDCYDAFDDCECIQGFARNDQDKTCTKPPTNAPVKPPTNAPVKPPTDAPVKPPVKAPRRPPVTQPVSPPTVCTYVCPANSYKTNPTGCAIQFSQCTCNPGFSKRNGQCVKY